MVRIPTELSADPDVRYDGAAQRVLYPVSLFVGLLYLVLAALHPVMVGGRGGLIMSVVAAATAAFLLGIAWWVRGRTEVPNATALLSAVILLMIVNSGLHLFITAQDWQTTNLMLVVIGAGMAVLATKWNVALTVLCWVAWVIGMASIPGVNWPHWLIAMAMATLVGQLMRFGRRNNLDTAAAAVELQVGLLTDAEELAESRQNLLATISHDVRTPVTGIVGMVDLLLQRPLDARTRELVVGVRHSADGLTTMLNNLLDLARVEAGRLEVHTSDADICDMVSEVLQMVGPMAQSKSIPLIGAASPDLHSWIHTDPSRFRQILLNLVSNAVKFTDEGVVTVVSRPVTHNRAPWVEICVTDTGPGMSDEAQAAAFESFVQGGPGVHKEHGGSGLGLAIAQRLTSALGGSLQLTSALGQGTTFRILLPVGRLEKVHDDHLVSIPGQVVVTGHPVAVGAVGMALERMGKTVVEQCQGQPGTLHVRVVCDTYAPEAAHPVEDGHRLLVLGPTVTVAASPTAGEYLPMPWTMDRLLEALGADVPSAVPTEILALPTGLRVLVAEDDTVNRNLIAEMLRRMGAEVTTVSDGAAAVEEVARDRFDVVLLDLNMPVMDGLEAVRVIRERLAGIEELAVIALSADPGWIDRSVLTAAGFNGYVMKPSTMADLQIGITKVLERLPVSEQLPAQRTADTQVSLDTGTLDQLGEDLGDPVLVRQTLGVYLEELPTRLVALHQGHASGSPEETRAVAHSLKGASGMLGAMRLSRLCAQMETQADDATLTELTAEAEQVETLMRSYLAEESVTG